MKNEFDMIPKHKCNECEDTKLDFFSCCGYDMRDEDHGICPQCKEHWEMGECEFCN